MEKRSAPVELPDAALDQIAGGCECNQALIKGNGDPNFKANIDTPAADLGLSFIKKPLSDKPGAYVGCAPPQG